MQSYDGFGLQTRYQVISLRDCIWWQGKPTTTSSL